MTKNKTGRPLKLAPAGAEQRIEALAADGFSGISIARGLGTSTKTLQRWFDDDPALKEAFDRGREQERYVLHNMLFKQATENGNATAAMFLLKARHGYREGDQSETGNRVSITFALPGALTMEDFTKVVGHGTADDRDQRVSAPRLTVTRGG